MKLFSYWRSTTSYRVRIALNLKGVSYRYSAVNLLDGDQHSDSFAKLNSSRGVPVLVLDDGEVLSQSLAILDYLEQVYPRPALLPEKPRERARVTAAAQIIATDIHPVNNLRVVNLLGDMLSANASDKVAWMHHWMNLGFDAFLDLIDGQGQFCFGDHPGWADICLVPQLYNAHRWKFDLSDYARLTGIEGRCLAIEAFERARPECQPDADQN